MFHCHADATGSNASSPSSANAIKNWIAKNGLPPVFSWTSSANGRARSGSQWSASAMSRPTSSSSRGASTISCTLASTARIASSVRRSGCAGPTSLSR